MTSIILSIKLHKEIVLISKYSIQSVKSIEKIFFARGKVILLQD